MLDKVPSNNPGMSCNNPPHDGNTGHGGLGHNRVVNMDAIIMVITILWTHSTPSFYRMGTNIKRTHLQSLVIKSPEHFIKTRKEITNLVGQTFKTRMAVFINNMILSHFSRTYDIIDFQKMYAQPSRSPK